MLPSEQPIAFRRLFSANLTGGNQRLDGALAKPYAVFGEFMPGVDGIISRETLL